MRILVTIGTRPEAIKLAPVVRELTARAWSEVRVLVTAQHRELVDEPLEFFGIRPDIDLDLMRPGQTLADLSGRALAAIDPVLERERPDLVLVQGDTTTVLMAALGCFYRGVPVGHVEAGLRSGCRDTPFPEEVNRTFVARLAALHFAPTAKARANLLAEGVDEAAVHVTGNTVIDALLQACERELPRDFDGSERPMILVTAHRRENHGAALAEVCDALAEIVRSRDVDVVFPVHPNPNVRAVVHDRLGEIGRVRLLEPLGYPAFVAAMRAAHLVITDSGGVQEEAPSLDKPVLVLRDATERTEGVAAEHARLVGTRQDVIVRETLRLLDAPEDYERMTRGQNPYGDGQASQRIADEIECWWTP